MTHKAFGSTGAARVLWAAWHGTYGPAPGHRCWRLGDKNSDGSVDLEYSADRKRWRVYQPWADKDIGWDVDRETARLLLRGLLAEEIAKELTEHLARLQEHYAKEMVTHGGDELTACALEEVEDKLREMGMINE